MFTKMNNVFLGKEKSDTSQFITSVNNDSSRKINWQGILKTHVIYPSINCISRIKKLSQLTSKKIRSQTTIIYNYNHNMCQNSVIKISETKQQKIQIIFP